MEPINCIVAIVLGGSLASMPSNAFDREATIRSLNESILLSSNRDEDKEQRRRARPEYATDVTAFFNWWVAVVCQRTIKTISLFLSKCYALKRVHYTYCRTIISHDHRKPLHNSRKYSAYLLLYKLTVSKASWKFVATNGSTRPGST
jgi:hypothetical protein